MRLGLERKLSKNEILEMYYNDVYWGQNIYGLRAASLEYFSKEPGKLSVSEQVILLTLLRGPNYYLNRRESLNSRYHTLFYLLTKRKKISVKKYTKSKKLNIAIGPKKLDIFGNDCIPYISSFVNHEHLYNLQLIEQRLS